MRGRPREDTARRSTVCIRLQEQEYDRLIAAASARGMRPTELVRKAALCVINKATAAEPAPQ